MADNIKTGIGFFIPVASLVGFVLSVLSNNYFSSIIFIVSGMMIWMLYILVVESNTPALMGNILILFVVLLSLAVFLNYGLSQNMFGGYELKSDGSFIALLVLFFGGFIAVCAFILPGISGSFILLLLGLYEGMISSIIELDYLYLSTLLMGCLAGLLFFIRF